MSMLLRKHSMGLAAAALGISVFLSRILGLVRDKVISYYFGSGLETDVYFTAFVVPDFIGYLLAGGYFSITLVPLLSQCFLHDEEDAWRFFSSAVSWAFIAISVLCLAAFVFASELAVAIAPGFSPEKQSLLARYLRIILPAQIFFLPGACFTAVLYCRKQFSVPALSPLVYNICIICGGMLFVYIAPEKGMEGFCWGVLAGAIVGSFLLPFCAVKAGGYAFYLQIFHPTMKKLLLLALPLMLGQSIVVLDEQFIRVFGSLAEQGSVSLLSYARRIMLVPVGVIAQAAGLASFPFLAALAAQHKIDELNTSLHNTLTNALRIAIPITLWMIVASTPIMRLIFQQGAFTAAEADSSGLLLAIMMSGVVFWTFQQIIGRAFYAWQDTFTPAILGTIATLVSLVAYYWGALYLGAAGIAIASTGAMFLYTLLLFATWRKKFGSAAFASLGSLTLWGGGIGSIAALGSFFAASWVSHLFVPTSLLGAWVFLCISGLCFVSIYLILAYLIQRNLLQPYAHVWYVVKKKLHIL